MKVVIMRGIQGAGKSTYVWKNFPDAVVCSADDYFFDKETGDYKWELSAMKDAHQYCRDKFFKAVMDQEPLIVVDNTNSQLWEFEWYINNAIPNGYEVEVIRIVVAPEVGAARNVHGVPKETVKRLYNRFEDFPTEKIIQGEV